MFDFVISMAACEALVRRYNAFEARGGCTLRVGLRNALT